MRVPAAFDPNWVCQTGSGYPLPFPILLRHALTARIRRVVLGAPSVIIDAGTSRRLFSKIQAQLIRQRDRTCTYPGCCRDATWCQIDHILDAHLGGPTDLANGQCLCRYHHRLKTRGRFRCEARPDGTIGFFRGILGSASKPLKTGFGYVVLFKRDSDSLAI